jgi:hypothetical protein
MYVSAGDVSVLWILIYSINLCVDDAGDDTKSTTPDPLEEV